MTRYSIDPWDPGYGVAFDADTAGAPTVQELNLAVETKDWRPIPPNQATVRPGAVLFCDGVRRIDARVWIHGDTPQPAPAIAASYAAGLVCCTTTAQIVDVRVERGLFTAAPDADGIGGYAVRAAVAATPESLSAALQSRLADLEALVALGYRAHENMTDDLVVVDGPIKGRTHVPRMVGYVKTHHTAYLPDREAAVVAALRPGERTPVFAIGTSWLRRTWYLKLPGPQASPWSGVVRVECSIDIPADEAIRLADVTALVLPPLASSPHKDPRAPQNLVPIGGLERHLKHRLGNQRVLYRTLRSGVQGEKV